jgi:serine protease Do
MRTRLRLVTSLLLFPILFASTPSLATIPVDSSLAPMLQGVLPSVVNIKAQIKITDFNTLRELQLQRDKNPQNQAGQALPDSYTSIGSGVIIDSKNGLIVTNAHVVNDAQIITVTLSDRRHFTAKIIGTDKPSDIALIKIRAANLVNLPIGDSNKVKVGDYVAAIGNPFGLSQTVTAGIVSAIGRTTLGIENFENFIQTDAPINPGNSGGALVNMQGQLVGINTAILAPDRGSIGIGFAIPANMAKSVIGQLIQYGNVKRGLLGISAQDVSPELATAFNLDVTQGAAVTQILSSSPAEQAGIKVGDIITGVNGSEIKNASDVVNTIGFLRVDSKINIELLRNNKHITATVTLTDPSKRKKIVEQNDPFLYGVGLKNFRQLSPAFGNVKGVLVVSVEQDSTAWNSDLRPGDVITSVNQQPINSIDDIKTISAKTGKSLLLNVIRGPGAVFLVINKDQA